MIIQDNFRFQFYEMIKREHVLIVVNPDVDALCAAAILTHIFTCDEVTYSLCPANSIDALKSVMNVHGEQTKNIILINSVGSASLLEFDLPENVNIWLIDSRRPIHLDNIYNAGPIKVIAQSSELDDWQIPEASAIFDTGHSGDEDEDETATEDGEETLVEDEEDEEQDNEEIENQEPDGDESREGLKRKRPMSRSSRPEKRRREELANIIGRQALARQQRAKWKRTRGTLLWEYYMKSWYAPPVSVLMLELAHELGKSSAEMMWCAAVGISSQFTDQLVSLEKYTEICADRMQPFIRKYGLRTGLSAEQVRNQLRVTFSKDLLLPLYTHWTLYESMSNESVFICQSKLWSQRGEDKFKEILSQLGLTLAECHQNFDAMKRDRRSEVFDILMKHLDTGFASFSSHLGYNVSYSAVDFARVLSLQLEYRNPAKNIGQSNRVDELCQRFETAHELLRHFFKTGGREMAPLGRSVDHYKLALRGLNELVKRCIVQKQVVFTSRYFLLTLSEQCPVLGYFSSRHFIFLFAHSMLRAFASLSKTSRRTRPLVVAVPMGGEDVGWYLVVGVMPLAELMADSNRKSIIGSAFKHVAKEANMELRQTLEPDVVMIKAMDRFRFFNNLDARFESV